MSRNLATDWFKHIQNGNKKESFVDAVRNSTVALGRLKELLNEYETEIVRIGLKEEDYNNTDWPFKAAFRNGRLAELKRIKDLLAFLD